MSKVVQQNSMDGLNSMPL